MHRKRQVIIKMFGRLFCFAIGIVYTDFIELSMTHLLIKKSRLDHFLKPRYMQNIRVFHIFLFCKIRWEVALECIFFISSMEETIRTSQKGICSYSFCRAFPDVSFEKIIKILSFVCAELFAKETVL